MQSAKFACVAVLPVSLFPETFRAEQLRLSSKLNCIGPKVNTFFGNLLLKIFQKLNYLNPKNHAANIQQIAANLHFTIRNATEKL